MTLPQTSCGGRIAAPVLSENSADALSRSDGLYDFSCLIAGAITSEALHQFEIKAGEAGDPIELELDPWVTLTVSQGTPTADPLLAGLFRTPSTVDGVNLWQWLNDPTVDPQRRACVFNIIAKLRCTPSPYGTPLIASVRRIMCAQLERLYVEVDANLDAAGGILAGGVAFRRDPGAPEAMHFRVVDWVRHRLNPPDLVDLALVSYRQISTHDALQVVYAKPDASAGKPPATSCYADLDIDLGGSTTDIVGFFIHMGELQGDAVITDHIDLYYELDNDAPLAAYKFYTLLPKE